MLTNSFNRIPAFSDYSLHLTS